VITGGAWKTIVYFSKADLVMALPVSMPADLEYHQAPVPLAAERTSRFLPASKLLMREAHGGAAWPAILAYSALALVTAGWLAVIVAGAISISRQDLPPRGPTTARTRRPAKARRRRPAAAAASL
jgi:hypothetical protein